MRWVLALPSSVASTLLILLLDVFAILLVDIALARVATFSSTLAKRTIATAQLKYRMFGSKASQATPTALCGFGNSVRSPGFPSCMLYSRRPLHRWILSEKASPDFGRVGLVRRERRME